MSQTEIKNIIIAGGGTAGWICAAAMSKLLGDVVDITLIESEAIGTVGVGEATIPQLRRLNQILGINEDGFISKTKGTFKLGIEFSNWGGIGQSYLHTFGDPGINLAQLSFHQYWLRAHLTGSKAEGFWDYSLHHKAAYAHKFARLERVGKTAMGGLFYAFHFDASLYAGLLRDYSEAKGVTRVEGIFESVRKDAESGNLTALMMQDGREIQGDLFIDCTGFRSRLLGQELSTKFHDWSDLLPCNRAITLGCERQGALLPYTKAIAHKAGWQWRIPLQHRIGNGHVFCEKYMSVDEATSILLNNLDGSPIGEPRVLQFKTGRRDKLWVKNVVGVGLASGFLEPLESTSIHFIQSNISKLIELLPRARLSSALRAEYNRQVSEEFDFVRDFLILHYHLNQREEPFWKAMREMNVPQSLKDKVELFRAGGRVYRQPQDLFRDTSWVQVMMGQGLIPKDYHPMADRISKEELEEFLQNVSNIALQAKDQLPSHASFIDSIVKD